MADKERRVFADHYKRYDGKHICVVTTAKDYESQEDTVIFYYVTYSEKNEYVTISLKNFNAKIKHNGKTVLLFTRQMQLRTPDWVWLNLQEDGFAGAAPLNSTVFLQNLRPIARKFFRL